MMAEHLLDTSLLANFLIATFSNQILCANQPLFLTPSFVFVCFERHKKVFVKLLNKFFFIFFVKIVQCNILSELYHSFRLNLIQDLSLFFSFKLKDHNSCCSDLQPLCVDVIYCFKYHSEPTDFNLEIRQRQPNPPDHSRCVRENSE